ncbi:MAG: HAMP domain-containing histidine kinase, partial [Candidatus Cloacimonetes bacterium]|nr:HAMP domain-containing histidine kinase [Candidatus Cloacimonadota bacterium]
LLKNCIDAMKNKTGTITITSFVSGNKFHIQVTDQGVGISKSMYKKIFEPGVTVKARGWGLGLSLTKRIIEEYHHGKIYVQNSTVGEGTTIEIILPRN